MPRITRYASHNDNCHTVIHRDIVRLQAGGNPALPDIAAQMQELLQRLEQHLAEAGSNKTHC